MALLGRSTIHQATIKQNSLHYMQTVRNASQISKMTLRPKIFLIGYI